jgi:hypothetical protein
MMYNTAFDLDFTLSHFCSMYSKTTKPNHTLSSETELYPGGRGLHGFYNGNKLGGNIMHIPVSAATH